MKKIEIDEEVFAELSRRAIGFNVTPNLVIRRILELHEEGVVTNIDDLHSPLLPSVSAIAHDNSTKILQFIAEGGFAEHRQAIDKFLLVLGWLNATHGVEFTEVALNFRKGNRVYFGKSQKQVEQSGDGITAKPIPQSSLWALTTLDNKAKRVVLEDMLRALKYSPVAISRVIGEIPDSGIRRGQRHLMALTEFSNTIAKH